MQELFQRLIKGDRELAKQFKASRRAWREFLKEFGKLNVDELAEMLAMHQARLEWPFRGNRSFAKEMLPITCLATLWSVKKDDYNRPKFASKVIEAIRKSTMSWEVKKPYLDRALTIFPQPEPT
jgi:hypothetical protein